MLADRITDSIVPDELVSGIVEDVESSRAIAEAALELARSAKYVCRTRIAMCQGWRYEMLRVICNYIFVAVTGRKGTLFHCKWANSISHNYL